MNLFMTFNLIKFNKVFTNTVSGFEQGWWGGAKYLVVLLVLVVNREQTIVGTHEILEPWCALTVSPILAFLALNPDFSWPRATEWFSAHRTRSFLFIAAFVDFLSLFI